MNSFSYCSFFRKTVVWSCDLQNPDVLEQYRMKGYKWIRRADPKRFADITRFPTVGFYVELYTSIYPGTKHLDSPAAKKMLKRLCYFTHDIR